MHGGSLAVCDDRIGQAAAIVAELPHQVQTLSFGKKNRIGDIERYGELLNFNGIIDGDPYNFET
jgi:hypothetical protein